MARGCAAVRRASTTGHDVLGRRRCRDACVPPTRRAPRRVRRGCVGDVGPAESREQRLRPSRNPGRGRRKEACAGPGPIRCLPCADRAPFRRSRQRNARLPLPCHSGTGAGWGGGSDPHRAAVLRSGARRNVDRLHRLLDVGGVPHAGRVDHRAARPDGRAAFLTADLLDERPLAFEHDDELVARGVALPSRPVCRRRVRHDQSARCIGGAVLGDVCLERALVVAESENRDRRVVGADLRVQMDRRRAQIERAGGSIGGRGRSSHRSPPEKLSVPTLPHLRAGSLPNNSARMCPS